MASVVVYITEKKTGRTTVGAADAERLGTRKTIQTDGLIVSLPEFDIGHQPTEASLYLTPACNLSCSYCYIVPFLDAPNADTLSTEQWKDVIDELFAFGIRSLKLIGGEALLRNDLGDILTHAESAGIAAIELTTNASRQIIKPRVPLLEQFRDLKLHKIVSTSLDSHLSEHNDKMRGKFDDVVAGIKILKELDLPVSLASVITLTNYTHLHEMICFALELGIDAYQFNNLVPIRDEQKNAVIMDAETKGHVVEEIERLRELYKDHIVVVNRFAPAPNIHKETFEHFAKQDVVARSSLSGCPAGTREVYVLPNGKLVACPMFIQFPEYHSVKRLGAHSFREIWEGDDAISSFREEVSTPKLYGACSGCSSGPTCKGGCRAMTYFMTGTLRAQDPRCLFGSGK